MKSRETQGLVQNSADDHVNRCTAMWLGKLHKKGSHKLQWGLKEEAHSLPWPPGKAKESQGSLSEAKMNVGLDALSDSRKCRLQRSQSLCEEELRGTVGRVCMEGVTVE